MPVHDLRPRKAMLWMSYTAAFHEAVNMHEFLNPRLRNFYHAAI